MASSSSVMASQTLILSNPTFLSPHSLSPPPLPKLHLFNSPKPLTLSLSTPKPQTPLLRKSRVFASSTSPSTTIPNNPTPILPLLSNSTRTITTIFALAQLVSKFFVHKIVGAELAAIHGLREGLASSVGPLFFASVRDGTSGSLNTPLTVVAAGMAKWLDIYSGVLLVRVLLSWFPNVPWDRQPLSAIRDLCDPYLNLFRNIVPPIMNVLDISPIFAFSVLGALASIMKNTRAY